MNIGRSEGGCTWILIDPIRVKFISKGAHKVCRRSKYPPAKPGALRLLAPQRGLTAIDQNQNREPFMVQPITISYSRHSGKSRNPVPFWIPGRVSFARNNNSTLANVKLCESPGRAGGLPRC